MNEQEMIGYHYCSLAKFVSIVRNKSFRLGNLFYMNDYKEVSWFFDLARNRLKNFRSDRSDEPSDLEAIDELDGLLEKKRFDHIYAVCFSGKNDDLSQWRGYADDGRGVVLGLSIAELAEAARCPVLSIEQIEYDLERQIGWIDSILDQFLDEESSSSSNSSRLTPAYRIFRELARIAPAVKNPAFASEDETRIIARTQVHPDSDLDPDVWSDEWFADFPHEVEFHESYGRLSPFTKIELPQTVVRSVGFGPRFGGFENQAALKLFVGKQMPDANVEYYESEASYRS